MGIISVPGVLAQVGAMIGTHRGGEGQIIAQNLQSGAGPAVKVPGPMLKP